MAEESIPIAALEHAAYCERQWGLIHLDRFFEDNDDTVRGHHVHERVDLSEGSARSGVRTEFRLPVWSDSLGLHGYCDAVEFENTSVRPVEYKSGKRFERPAEIQVCAQAMCLEGMFSTSIGVGIVYLAGTRTRHEVDLDEALRVDVRRLIALVRTLDAQPGLPPPRADARCRACSFEDHCMPMLVADRRRVGGLHGATWHQ